MEWGAMKRSWKTVIDILTRLGGTIWAPHGSSIAYVTDISNKARDLAPKYIRTSTLYDMWEAGYLDFAPSPNMTPERADLNRSEEHTSELQSLRHLVCRL